MKYKHTGLGVRKTEFACSFSINVKCGLEQGGQRSLVGYSRGPRVGHDLVTKQQLKQNTYDTSPLQASDFTKRSLGDMLDDFQFLCPPWASLVAQMVKNLPAMQEICVPSLGREDPLKKGMVTHFSILAWRIPWTEESGRLQKLGSQRVEQY